MVYMEEEEGKEEENTSNPVVDSNGADEITRVPVPPPPPLSQTVQKLNLSKVANSLSFFQNIEKMIPAPVAKENHGKFYIGDSYICLFTDQSNQENVIRRIHYWIGKMAPLDSAAAAAVRSKELSDVLGGHVPHYREPHGEESESFSRCFNSKLEYLEGGSESAFRHVKAAIFKPQLLRLIESPTKIKIKSVGILSSQLRRDDVCILDLGKQVYIWSGEQASRAKRTKASDIAGKLKEEHTCSIPVQVLDENDECELFWDTLGGKPNIFAKSVKDEDDNDDDAMWVYKISEEFGKLSVVPLEEQRYTQATLDSHSCYIVDCESELFVWQGKASPLLERKTSMALAKEIYNMFERPEWTTLKIVEEDRETCLFKEKFDAWNEAIVQPIKKEEKRSRANSVSDNFSVASLFLISRVEGKTKSHSNAYPEEKTLDVVEGKGSLELWNSAGKNWDRVVDDDFGQFLCTHSYVCHYIYHFHSGGEGGMFVLFEK